jgi:hypothetical protein
MPDKYRKLIDEAEAELAQKARAGLPRAFSPRNDGYNLLDKAKYAARAAGEGAGLNLADIIAGITNVPASYGAQAQNAVEGRPAEFKSPLKLFGEGRRDFINEQRAYAEAHPALNTAGEIIGSLLGFGKAAKALKAAPAAFGAIRNPITRNALTSAAAGGLYGFNGGLTEDESPSIFKAFREGGAGVLSGAAFSAIPSADRIQHRLRLNIARRRGLNKRGAALGENNQRQLGPYKKKP